MLEDVMSRTDDSAEDAADNPTHQTRTTLIRRLKDWQDEASWQEFFHIYWRLIYGVARKSGMTDAEAQDVVQETMLAVAKHMPTFTYDPQIGSFKGWLLNMTRWRIQDQFRKRRTVDMTPPETEESETGTSFINRVPDPTSQHFDAVWELEWQQNLLTAALDRVKRSMDPQKYQIFDLYVNQGWAPEKVAQNLSIPVDQVYLAKHRITQLIKSEVERLEKGMRDGGPGASS
jgi:RNA polymerase sigma factor (sigma-70 family)